jgi:hypothetical protein
LVVFGWDGKLKAVSISLNSKTVTNLSIEGEMQGKGERCQMVNTSEGKGLMIDGIHCGSFQLEDKSLLFQEWASSEEVVFDKVAPI